MAGAYGRAHGRPKHHGRGYGDIGVPVHLGYTPFKHTIKLHAALATHRERVAVTGSRAGKTTAGVHDVFVSAMMQPGYNLDDHDAGEPYTIFVGAPTYSMVDRVILPALLRIIPPEIVHTPYNHARREITIHAAGANMLTTIYFLSAGLTTGMSDRWKGVKAYGVWLDEFPVIKESMYDEARTRLLDRQGWLLMTGTPQGLNWAYDRIKKPIEVDEQRFKDGLPPLRPDLYFGTWHTADNPHLPEGVRDELERHKKTMPPKYFARTYLASWDIFEGQVYDMWTEGVHVVSEKDYTFISSGRSIGKGKKVVRLDRVVAGVDWGSKEDHKGVILVLGKARDTWYVLEESVAPVAVDGQFSTPVLVRARTMIEDSWTKRALALHAKWRIGTFYCDPARPENLRMFREANLPNVEAALNSVDPGIQRVAMFMNVDEEAYARGEISTKFHMLDCCPVTIGEVRHYHWKPGSRKQEPEKVMDDTMDALRYALYTAEERGEQNRKANFDFA